VLGNACVWGRTEQRPPREARCAAGGATRRSARRVRRNRVVRPHARVRSMRQVVERGGGAMRLRARVRHAQNDASPELPSLLYKRGV